MRQLLSKVFLKFWGTQAGSTTKNETRKSPDDFALFDRNPSPQRRRLRRVVELRRNPHAPSSGPLLKSAATHPKKNAPVLAHSYLVCHRRAAPQATPIASRRCTPSGQIFAPPQTPVSRSVNGEQDSVRLRVLEHVLPQHVVLVRASLSKSAIAKRQMTVGIETTCDPKGVSR